MLTELCKKFGWAWVVLAIFSLTGCDNGSTGTVSSSLPPITPDEAPIDAAVLDSAASFLAAATGKSNPVDIDQIVFINSVLGINQPEELAAFGTSSGLEGSMGCLYGDLWITLRDVNGAPVLDEQGCKQPIASQPIELPLYDENGDPVMNGDEQETYFSNTVPMTLEEDKCEVAEGFEEFVIPVEMGRLNMVRSSVKNPETMARAFEEAMKNINASDAIKTDLSGRLVLISEQELLDEAGNIIGTEFVETSIDSPRENLALYRALMVSGRLVGFGVEKTGEEGQTIPAPWLEIRPDIDLGDLIHLREGTPGRDRGVGLINGYADLSVAFHSTKTDYSRKFTDYVQFHQEEDPVPEDFCPYTDENNEVWERVFSKQKYQGSNIRGFAKHADDARKMIVFMHKKIQNVPHEDSEPTLDAVGQSGNIYHEEMGIAAGDPRHLMLETAASALGAASGKEVPLSVDSTVFINTVLGINQLGELSAGDLYGDLWVLKRTEDGVPEYDDKGCVMPISSEPIVMSVVNELGETEDRVMDTVPMVLEEYMDGLYKCAPMPGYEEYVMEVEVGRLNCVRSAFNNPGMLDRHLYEVVNRINDAVSVKRDLAGRIILTTEQITYDDAGEIIATTLVDSTIDSPLENLAIYKALMTSGTLEVPVTFNHEGSKETFTLAIRDDLDLGSMGYLKHGDGTHEQPTGIGHHATEEAHGYADFTEVVHCPKADYVDVLVDFVERQDDICPYDDRNGEIWTRVLNGEVGVVGEDDAPARNIAAFVQHADNVRRVIVFTHSIIQDPVEDF